MCIVIDATLATAKGDFKNLFQDKCIQMYGLGWRGATTGVNQVPAVAAEHDVVMSIEELYLGITLFENNKLLCKDVNGN